MVEPAPQDMQVLRGCGFNLTECSCWALVPQVCSDLPRNRATWHVYGSLALKALQFLSAQACEKDLAILSNF